MTNRLDALLQSTQTPPDGLQQNAATFGVSRFRGPILPAWGTRLRLTWLRDYYFHDRNWLGQSAFSGLADRVASTPYEIAGPDGPAISCADRLFKNSNFGRGWGNFCTTMVLNFFRYDIGAWAEVIAPGSPTGPVWGQATGIATLDPMRVFPTGDPLYPAIYRNTKGKYYLLHHERVIQIIDAPDGADDVPGWGLCALSRAISIVKQVLLMGQYNESYLDDNPTPGMLLYSNISMDQVEQMWARYEQILRGDGLGARGKKLELFALLVDAPVSVQSIPFSVAPEKFDYVAWTDLSASAFALAMGVDKQEIWELSRGNLGTSTQSEILHRKSQGRKIAALYAAFERNFNNNPAIIPPELRWQFRFQDTSDDLERAQVTNTHAQTIQVISSNLSQNEIREYLSATDETLRRVMTDKSGKMRSLIDSDTEPDVIRDDTEPVDADKLLLERKLGAAWQLAPKTILTKGWQQTRTEFTDTLGKLVVASSERSGGRGANQRYAAGLRGLLSRLGTQAYLDGLREGGGGVRLELEDEEQIQKWLASTLQFRQKLMSDTSDGENPVSKHTAILRAELWASKSLREIYLLGKVTGAANKFQVWELGSGEHCPDCLRLAGQVHRLRAWHNSGWLPGATKLKCGGWRCGCSLQDTKETQERGEF